MSNIGSKDKDRGGEKGHEFVAAERVKMCVYSSREGRASEEEEKRRESEKCMILCFHKNISIHNSNIFLTSPYPTLGLG